MNRQARGRSARMLRSALLAFGGAALCAAAIGAVAAALRMARLVVTPPGSRNWDIRILGVDSAASTIRLSLTAETVLPGRYSLWFDGDRGHARVGAIVSKDSSGVTRELLHVDRGRLVPGDRARISAWFFPSAEALGLPFEEVSIRTALGPAPAWRFPAERPSGRWVIQVHGRGVLRQEGLRAVEPFRAAGFDSLLISYRNDTVAPSSADGKYALGGMEWSDVDAAMSYAVRHGATSLVLMGWSMGGAIALQAATRSSLADRVEGIVLESPVIDWVSTLTFHARIARLPRPIARLALRMLGSRRAGPLVRQHDPIDFAALDFVARAHELHVPVLLLHSSDDGYVPIEASDRLAESRGDLVTYRRWSTAHHTRLWNYDSERWTAEISEWIQQLPMSRRDARAPGA